MSDNPSPESFPKCTYKAKRLVAEWKFKDLVSEIWGIIDEADVYYLRLK